MLYRFFKRFFALCLILQAIFLFIHSHMEAKPLMDKIFISQALFCLIFGPWLRKVSWVIPLTFTIMGTVCILKNASFEFILPYYSYFIFLPLVVGIILFLSTYLSFGKPQKAPKNSDD